MKLGKKLGIRSLPQVTYVLYLLFYVESIHWYLSHISWKLRVNELLYPPFCVGKVGSYHHHVLINKNVDMELKNWYIRISHISKRRENFRPPLLAPGQKQYCTFLWKVARKKNEFLIEFLYWVHHTYGVYLTWMAFLVFFFRNTKLDIRKEFVNA